MKERLFSEFQEVSAKAWKQKIQYDLKGADYNEKLVWESPEGIKVKPFYHLNDFQTTVQHETHRTVSWKIAHKIFVSHGSKANKKARHFLKSGIESLIFTIPSDKIEIKELLSGLDLNAVSLYFQFQFLSVSYIKDLMTLLATRKSPIYLNFDLIGNLTRTGNWFSNRADDEKSLNEIFELSKEQENLRILSVDISLYQNAGANMVQQLAYAMAHVNEYLHLYGSYSFGQAVFKVSVGNDYFFEIAKLRALRRLWRALSSEYGINSDCHIVASPSKRNKTLYAYNTNMLRTTTECMSAILGAADTIYNLSYDGIYHKDNEFAERIARNQLLLLKNESYFEPMEDPAHGTYYVETLTEQLAEKALRLFKKIEEKGGFLRQLKNHTIQRKIRENAVKEQRKFDAGEEVLVGTNVFENSQDQMKDTIEIYPFVQKNQRKTIIEPIIEKRLAEKIEKEKLDAEGWKGRSATQ